MQMTDEETDRHAPCACDEAGMRSHTYRCYREQISRINAAEATPSNPNRDYGEPPF